MTVCIASGAGTLWYSSNYGSTWTQAVAAAGLPINTNYTCVSMSGSGQYQLVGVNNAASAIYLSTNYGATWAAISGLTGYWFRYALSYTGQYQYVGESVASTGKVYFSSNYGASFTQVTAFTGNVSGGICCSASGQYVTVTLNGGYIWYSSNYGVSWASVNSTAAWQGVCCSASGQYQTAAVYNGSLYYSNNYGVSWTSSGAPTLNWVNVTCSASGQYQMATGNSMGVYYSTNYGVSWTQSSAPSGSWWIAMSQNGLYTLGMITSGGVYLSTLANISMLTNGRVGIGITNPSNPLNVWSNLTMPSITTASIWPAQFSILGNSAAQLNLKMGAYYTPGVAEYCAIQATETYAGIEHPMSICLQPIGGYVGIGTTNPQTALHVYGASYPTIRISDSTNTSSSMEFVRDQINNLSIIRSSGRMDFESPGGYQRITITPSYGSVGIGTTDPKATLHVNGKVSSGLWSNSCLLLTNGFNTTIDQITNGTSIQLTNGANSTCFDIMTYGYTASPNSTLYITGNSQVSGGNIGVILNYGGQSWGQYSDSRMKIDITPLPSAISSIIRLNPVSYLYDIDPTEHTHIVTRIGFLADEIDQIYPNLVTKNTGPNYTNSKGETFQPMTMCMTDLIPYLTKGIQELAAENTQLKSSMAALEARLSAAGIA